MQLGRLELIDEEDMEATENIKIVREKIGEGSGLQSLFLSSWRLYLESPRYGMKGVVSEL